MKYIGFIKKHDSKIATKCMAESQSNSVISNTIKSQIISYLNNGIVVMCWMGYASDIETGDLIGQDCYYTDGNWVWPVYFPYYIDKYKNYEIDHDFITYLLDNNFQYPDIEIDIISIEDNLIKEMTKKE